jgi:hypothetical protein
VKSEVMSLTLVVGNLFEVRDPLLSLPFCPALNNNLPGTKIAVAVTGLN